MSYHVMDYLPFDYNRYVKEILPALGQARAGNFRPLQILIHSATHFSLWPMLGQPASFSSEVPGTFFYHQADLPEALELLFGESKREDEFEEVMQIFEPWASIEKIIPTLAGKSFDEWHETESVLHLCLLYTFCCDLPVETKKDPIIFTHEEQANDWQNYLARDEETKALWAPFNQPAPAALTSQLISTYMPVYKDEIYPRKLDIYGALYATPTGFITPEEAHYLLANIRIHEEPLLVSILSGCIRDNKDDRYGYNWNIDVKPAGDTEAETTDDEAVVFSPDASPVYQQWMQEHPEGLSELMQHYYRALWNGEDRVVERLRYAVERGWGMLEIYD